MAVFSGYTCDECGTQAQHPDRWLVLSALDVHRLLSGTDLVSVSADLDFCSPGCLIRWLSKAVEKGSKVAEQFQLEVTDKGPMLIAKNG